MFCNHPLSRALRLPHLRPPRTSPYYHFCLPSRFFNNTSSSSSSSSSCLFTPPLEPGAYSDPAAADSANTILHLLRSTDPSAVSSALRHCGVSPTPSLVASLLDSPASSLSSLPAASLLSFSLWARPHLPAHLLASLVDLLARSRSFNSAWSLLLSRPSPLPAFAPLLRRYARAGSPSAAVRTFRFLLRHPESLAAPHADCSCPFDLLIDALCKEGHPRAAADLVRRRRCEDGTWSPPPSASTTSSSTAGSARAASRRPSGSGARCAATACAPPSSPTAPSSRASAARAALTRPPPSSTR
uniref:Pentatricopeptide repeat-containing protein n=1 Tax=Ananas comosus var. bracteatus TaxID=296719 RepID=A0A6V7PUK2_ANACO|nr:unnamed protein product [Ananas comosus var. bracteatus]